MIEGGKGQRGLREEVIDSNQRVGRGIQEKTIMQIYETPEFFKGTAKCLVHS